MIEFKQIIGRGTRLFDGKDHFTIYDFVRAYEHFTDPDWDGEPQDPVPPTQGPPATMRPTRRTAATARMAPMTRPGASGSASGWQTARNAPCST